MSVDNVSPDENGSYLPLVFGPEFAIASIPAPVNLNSGWISSSLDACLETEVRNETILIRTTFDHKCLFHLYPFQWDLRLVS